MRRCRCCPPALSPAVLVAGALAALTAGAAHSAPPELKRLQVLLVIDTNSNLALSVEKDRRNMEALLTNHIPRDRVRIDTLKGKQVTRKEVLTYYKNLKSGPDEALLFFYAGHGVLDRKKGHCFQPQGGKIDLIPRSEVKQAMEATKAGLVVLLSDCCSTRLRAKPEPKAAATATRPLRETKLHPVLRCLLFQHRGVADVTAAVDGTGSFGDDLNGGIFTQALCRLLDDELKTLDGNRDQFLSWKEFFPLLSKQTEKTFRSWSQGMRAVGEKVDQSTQKPQFFALPENPFAVPAGKTYAILTLINGAGETVRYRYRWTGEKDWKDGEIAKDGRATHDLLLTNDSELPSLEIEAKSDSDDGKGKLAPGKWTGEGRPDFKAAPEYRISSKK